MHLTNVAAVLDEAARLHPARVFLIAGEQKLSYAAVADSSGRFAAVLDELGLQSGQTVALLLPNIPEFAVCHFGALKFGALVAPLNFTSPAAELAHYLADAGAQILVTTTDLLPVASQAAAATACCRTLLVVDAPAPGQAAGAISLPQRLAAAHPMATTAAVAADTPALLLYTSGTTGKPKAAVVTHRNILSFAPIFSYDMLRLDGDSVLLMNAPGSHAIGQILINVAPFVQCTLSLLPRFEPKRFVETVQRDQVTALAAVPSLVQFMIASPLATPEAFGSLRVVVVGGSTLAHELALRLAEQFAVRVIVTYAATETFHVSHGEVPQLPAGSVGQLARGVELRVVDETLQDLPDGEPGELLVRSGHVFRGYHNMPDQAQTHWCDDWFRTGDVGYLDATGYLYLVGRIKEIIKTSGYTVYPAEVEAVLQTHPAVAMAAVAGVPNASAGELVAAFIVPKPDTTVTAQEISDFCKLHLAPYKCPRRIEFRAQLPLNSAGKLLRQQLLES